MNYGVRVLQGIDSVIGFLLKTISIFCLSVLFLLLAGNVLFRIIPVVSFGWFDEIVEMLFAWLSFLGAAALWRENEHFRIDFFLNKLAGKTGGYILELVLNLIALAFFVVLAYYGLRLTVLARDWTPIFKMPKKILYACVPISGGFMAIYTLRNMFQNLTALLKAKV